MNCFRYATGFGMGDFVPDEPIERVTIKHSLRDKLKKMGISSKRGRSLAGNEKCLPVISENWLILKLCRKSSDINWHDSTECLTISGIVIVQYNSLFNISGCLRHKIK